MKVRTLLEARVLGEYGPGCYFTSSDNRVKNPKDNCARWRQALSRSLKRTPFLDWSHHKQATMRGIHFGKEAA